MALPTLTAEGQQHKGDAGVRMERTSGAVKTMYAAAAGVTLTGLLAILYGITRDGLPRSIGGLGLTIVGLTTLVLLVIRRWITDTSEERTRLASATAAAQTEKARHFAAQAAMELEQGRLRRDLDAERIALFARLTAEREAMLDEFEDRRATLISETMEATVLMMRGGKLPAPAAPAGNLIEFPRQHCERHPERARSREHGVVGP
jgi:hypothetical protein